MIIFFQSTLLPPVIDFSSQKNQITVALGWATSFTFLPIRLYFNHLDPKICGGTCEKKEKAESLQQIKKLMSENEGLLLRVFAVASS